MKNFHIKNEDVIYWGLHVEISAAVISTIKGGYLTATCFRVAFKHSQKMQRSKLVVGDFSPHMSTPFIQYKCKCQFL